MGNDILVLFPGALGDFICFRPTLLTLRAGTRGRATVAAQPALSKLLAPEEFTHLSIDRSEMAELFASGPLSGAARNLFQGYDRALSWTGHGNPTFVERLASATGAQVAVYPFREMETGEHAVDYYARCANVQPAWAEFHPGPEAHEWAATFWKRHALTDHTLAVHPGSGSTAKNWLGMSRIIAWWQNVRHAKVLTLVGPAEAERGIDATGDAEARNEPLNHVAALIERSFVYVGNDSGISHLAALVGTPTVVLFGPTDPSVWCPLGRSVRVVQAAEPCRWCGTSAFCTHRLPVAEVTRAISEVSACRSAKFAAPGGENDTSDLTA
jgi:heptosyltransferase III